MSKKNIIITVVIVVVVFILVSLFGRNVVKAAPSYFTREQTAVATSTLAVMTPGTATTTLSFPTYEVDKVDLFIQVTASSTASALEWKYQFSNNNIDWFDEDFYATPNAGTPFIHATTTLTHRWDLDDSTASTSRKALATPNIVSNYKRVVFTVPVGTNNLLLWAEATLKRDAF